VRPKVFFFPFGQLSAAATLPPFSSLSQATAKQETESVFNLTPFPFNPFWTTSARTPSQREVPQAISLVPLGCAGTLSFLSPALQRCFSGPSLFPALNGSTSSILVQVRRGMPAPVLQSSSFGDGPLLAHWYVWSPRHCF